MNPQLFCAYCDQPAEGNYSIHRDGFAIGPQVMLCNACGKGDRPTCEEIWAKIANPEPVIEALHDARRTIESESQVPGE